jgi:hypothetical protein
MLSFNLFLVQELLIYTLTFNMHHKLKKSQSFRSGKEDSLNPLLIFCNQKHSITTREFN